MYIATGTGGYFFSSRENTVIIFHLISIVKYNNIIYVNVIIIHNDVRYPGPVNNIIYVNVIMIYSDVRNQGPVNNIIYVNLFIIYSDVINPEPAYNIIYVNVIIIYNDVRNPGPVNNIIYVNVIIMHSDVPRADTQTDNFPTCTLQREKGVISFQVEKILLLFSI